MSNILELKESQKLMLEHLQNSMTFQNTCLHAATRSGKTLATLLYLRQQKYDSILWLAYDVDERDFGLQKEIDKFGFTNYFEDRLITILPHSLHTVDDAKWDCIVYNECHTISERRLKSLIKLNQFNTKIIGLTGTYPNNPLKRNMLKLLGLTPDFEYSTDDGVEDNTVADYRIIVLETGLSDIKNIHIKTKNHNFFTSEYASYTRINNKIQELQLKWKDHLALREKISDRIRRYNSYAEESEENQEILRRLYTKSKKLSEKLEPYTREYSALRLQLSITLNNSPSKNRIAKILLDKYKNQRYLVFTNNTSSASKITEYVYNSKTSNKYFKDFQAKRINHLCLVNKGGTGTTYEDLDGCIVTSITSSNADIVQKIGRTLLFRKGYVAKIIFIITKDTPQKEWLLKALGDLDQNKITFKTL